MDFYENDNLDESKIERVFVGYDFYDKSEVWSDEDHLFYKGHLYHRENFLQASLDIDGNFVDPEQSEE